MLRRQKVDLYVVIHQQLQRPPSWLYTQVIPNLFLYYYLPLWTYQITHSITSQFLYNLYRAV